jgi:glycosyltransferase involved in cell wall biosynthesis
MKNFFSNKSKIKIFNNWVNDYEKNKNKNKNKNKILAVGRLEEQKNYKNLIVNLQNSPLELDIVGYGTQREELSNLAKEYNVKTNFLNTLSHSDLIDLYKEYSFYIIFSHFEGHPKSLIEAMSCGCIPIALNSEYIHEIIVDSTNGLILNSDQEKIERKIDLLNSNDEFFKEISNNAFRFTQDNYSLKKLLKRELELYKELCS